MYVMGILLIYISDLPIFNSVLEVNTICLIPCNTSDTSAMYSYFAHLVMTYHSKKIDIFYCSTFGKHKADRSHDYHMFCLYNM